MTVSRSLSEAHKYAIAGGNDSQDSQAILDAYKAEFGVETVCSPCLKTLNDTGRRSHHITSGRMNGVLHLLTGNYSSAEHCW